MNIEWSKRVLAELHRQGVRDVILCAGARNAPIVSVLAQSTGFTVHSFFEERSASFFALGVSRRSGRPVAVVTTSGTAVAELLPAVIEAFHTGVPLIAVTADRPRRLRGTGAPQAIDQFGLFRRFIQFELDLEDGEIFTLDDWGFRAPIHVNICFDEPLLDEKVTCLDLGASQPIDDVEAGFAGRSVCAITSGTEWATLRLTKFLKSPGPLVVIVGSLETARERDACVRFLKTLGVPVYLEGTSGLRERTELHDLALRSGDRVLAWALKRNLVSRVLRLGGVPTVRIWRDLEDPSCAAETLSLSPLPFAGLSRGELVCTDITATLGAFGELPESKVAHGEYEILRAKDKLAAAELRNLIATEPQAEASLMHGLSLRMKDASCVYVGNSLPIRQWDLAASLGHPVVVEANRGVNGIDGQVSTFIGLARSLGENWGIFGDLTALYDLAAPWALNCRPELKFRLVVINNGGGQIFQRIFNDPLFENRHSIEFGHWAKMWSIDYEQWRTIPAEAITSPRIIIEVRPDPEASRRFWDRYEEIWSNSRS